MSSNETKITRKEQGSSIYFVLALTTAAVTLSLVYWKKKPLKKIAYIPFSSSHLPMNTLVVDSSHSSARQITHHLKGMKQKLLMDLSIRGDSSTDGMLNALLQGNHPDLIHMEFITANHFDIDSFLPIWSGIHPKIALKYKETIREVARIGDFRELRLDEPFQSHALKLACYLNSEERRLFYKPFEAIITTEDGEVEAIEKFNVSSFPAVANRGFTKQN
jgi:hypothetical protein